MVNILWDDSHLWGYLLLHAMRSAEIPYTVVKGVDIAQAGLSGKVLVVPGGTARGKAEALAKAGQEAVRNFVADGGHYLGFCGGAGLALADGLGLCPWHRAGMTDRLQHLVSGHVLCNVGEEGRADALVPGGMTSALLPVWWPGRFHEPEQKNSVRVLARYSAPGPDLYVADLPLRTLPAEVLAEWNAMYGVTVRPSLLDGQPCVIAGNFGRGDWLLSYSHLETPAAEISEKKTDAESWFHHILRMWTGANPCAASPWQPEAAPMAWEDATLLEMRDELASLTQLALDLGLLFPRTPWLFGWKTGTPGAQLNSLRLAVLSSLALEPSNARVAAWNIRRGDVAAHFRLFAQGARSWLLARRLADTLADSCPDVLPKALLADQRQMLFGSSMNSGGLCGSLLEALEALLFAE